MCSVTTITSGQYFLVLGQWAAMDWTGHGLTYDSILTWRRFVSTGFDFKCDSEFHDGGRRLIDQVVNCGLDQVYQLLFTPSTFFVDTLRSQNITGKIFMKI